MKKLSWNYFLLLSTTLIFLCTIAGCKSTGIKETSSAATQNFSISNMTLREKIGQLFVIRPESIDETISLEELHSQFGKGITELTPEINDFYCKYPAGGFALFGKNIKNPQQLTQLNKQLHNLNNITPLLFIDEEGGVVSRVAENKQFNVTKFDNMAEIGKTGNTENAFNAGYTIGSYLREYGFDVDFAPIADVNTNPKNPVIGTRAFSNTPSIAARMDLAFLDGLHKARLYGCLKHFPGHGDTKTDTHNGYAETSKTWEELKNCEMVTFQAGINAGVQMIMTAHISTPSITKDNKPATLSYTILTEKLRNEMGFNGIIITDAMEMGAIRKSYSSAEAAILALEAGADIILMPYDYKAAFEGVLSAVESGRISEKRINESVERILQLKNTTF